MRLKLFFAILFSACYVYAQEKVMMLVGTYRFRQHRSTGWS